MFCELINRTTTPEGCARRLALGACTCTQAKEKDRKTWRVRPKTLKEKFVAADKGLMIELYQMPGMTARKVALKMGLSRRTVENAIGQMRRADPTIKRKKSGPVPKGVAA